MSDRIIRITAAGGLIYGFFADTKETAARAQEIHKTSASVSAALGRTLTAAAMISGTLKNKNDNLTVIIDGDGPAGKITVVADREARVRGYAENPFADTEMNQFGKIDVAKAVGKNGRLTVIKDLGLKHPYVGSVELQSGEIAEDFAYYFATSEQTPTVIALGVLVDRDLTVKRAGGYLLQLLPGAGDDIVSYIEEQISHAESVTDMLEKGMSPEDMASLILGHFTYSVTDEVKPEYFCPCTAERMKRNLLSIGRKDLMEIVDDGKDIELQCHFCEKRYVFDPEQIKREIHR